MTSDHRHRLDLLRVLTAKELKLRYKHTFLGYAWSVLHPLAFAAVYFVVVRKVMRVEVENYPLFLICGLFPWQWFQNSVTAANHFFLGNAPLLKKVRFERSTLVLAGVLNDLIHFAASVPVIALFLLFGGTAPSPAWLWQVPLLAAVQFAFTYGLALAVATANLFFRDLERLTLIGTMLWFFMTPILFPADMIPPAYQWVRYANPMGALAECWRGVFLDGVLPPGLFAAAAGWAMVAWTVGTWIYRRKEWRFAEVV